MKTTVRSGNRLNTAEVVRQLSRQSPAFSAAFDERWAALEIAELLRDLREQAGFTQAQIAKIAGMAQSQVSLIEAGGGAQGPTTSTIARYASALGFRIRFTTVPLKLTEDPG